MVAVSLTSSRSALETVNKELQERAESDQQAKLRDSLRMNMKAKLNDVEINLLKAQEALKKHTQEPKGSKTTTTAPAAEEESLDNSLRFGNISTDSVVVSKMQKELDAGSKRERQYKMEIEKLKKKCKPELNVLPPLGVQL